MTVRVVLATVLLVAVAGVALPAVQEGSERRTARQLDAAVERLERAMALLVDREDATAADLPGARRVVRLSLPERSLAAAGVASFAVRDDAVSYRLRRGHRREVTTPVPVRPQNGAVVLRDARVHRLRLGLARPGDPVVTVRRLDPNRTAEG